jgi:hypothetical protein
MSNITPFVGAVATIFAAVVGGAITFLVAVFTKESKISEFRQNWIDGLRDDTSRFIGTWYHVAAELELVDPSEYATREFWRSMKSELLELEILQSRIELRLNPDEHRIAIAKVKFLANGESLTALNHDQRKAQIESFSETMQSILRDEWRRVKRGEETYRLVKTYSKWALVLCLLLLLTVGVLNFMGIRFAP